MRKILPLLLLLAFAACTNYGKKVKFGTIEVYYKDGVSKAEADHMARVLQGVLDRTNPEAKQRKSFQLTKPNDTVLLRMVVDKDRLAGIPDASFQAILVMVSDSVFGGRPVNMELTNEKFSALKKLPFVNTAPGAGFGEMVTVGNVELYMKGFPREQGEILAAFFDREVKPETVISYQVLGNEGDRPVVKMASTAENAARLTEQQLQAMVEKLSVEVFSYGPLLFQLTDTYFDRVFREYEQPQTMRPLGGRDRGIY